MNRYLLKLRPISKCETIRDDSVSFPIFDIAPPANAGLVDPHITGSRTYGTRVGAYDNTAGTSMVLAAGEAMASMPYDTRRTMVYCLWSGEEGGLRGSDYWTDTLADRYPDVTVTNYINLDMAGVNWPGAVVLLVVMSTEVVMEVVIQILNQIMMDILKTVKFGL